MAAWSEEEINMRRISVLFFALAVVIGLTAQSHATLYVRGTDTLGNQLIYDDDFDITWYDYTNASGTWDKQMAWASGLTVDFGGTIYTDWRLPTALNQDGSGPCYGFNCIGSEMGHLYFTELGNVAFGSLAKGDFQNLLGSNYWSGTDCSTNPTCPGYFAWYFYFFDGTQDAGYKGSRDLALAVRDGDVSAVPEPGTMLLLGSGLVGLAAFRKRLKR